MHLIVRTNVNISVAFDKRMSTIVSPMCNLIFTGTGGKIILLMIFYSFFLKISLRTIGQNFKRFNQSQQWIRKRYTAKNTVILPNFLCRNFAERHSGKAQSANCSKLSGSCPFPQNFDTRKFSEITVFYAVIVGASPPLPLK